jgi:Homeodomain-like domain
MPDAHAPPPLVFKEHPEPSWRTGVKYTCIQMPRLRKHGEWSRAYRRRRGQEALFKKVRQEAVRLAALGLSYSKVVKLLGFTKGTLCKWLKQEAVDREGVFGQGRTEGG